MHVFPEVTLGQTSRIDTSEPSTSTTPVLSYAMFLHFKPCLCPKAGYLLPVLHLCVGRGFYTVKSE